MLAVDGRILRFIRAAGEDDFRAARASRAAEALVSAGKLVRSRDLDPKQEPLLSQPAVRDVAEALDAKAIVEHERIPFPSFPYEWAPQMLREAALLTLELAETLLEEGLGLKDAAPYNVLFRGPNPVFIDLLSIERRAPGDPIWLPYAQFLRTFVLPLLANKHFGLALDQLLTTRRDGLEPDEVYRWLKFSQKWRPPFLTLVTIPSLLTARQNQDDAGIYRKRTDGDPEKARFILRSQFRRLRSVVKGLGPKTGAQSTWSGYMANQTHYSAGQFSAKEEFVRQALVEHGAKRVLDVGCNTGHFSELAARSGASVVSLDYDPVVVGQVWERARREGLDILPLAVNLTRPTPGTGWRNGECASFLDRARGGFDAVMMLAVIHHMLVTERTPLAEILRLASELTTNLLIIEYVAPEDPMFRRIVRGREELHRDLTLDSFEAACRGDFEIIRRQHNDGASRALYVLKKR